MFQVAVVGVGSELGGDDAAGLEVVRHVRERVRPGIAAHALRGDLTELLDAWRGCQAAVLVDAMRSGATPGSVRRMEVGRDPLPPGLAAPASTHGISLLQAIELARALRRMPSRVVLYAVEAGRLRPGAGISAQVAAAIPDLVDAVVGEAARLARGGAGYARSSEDRGESCPSTASI